MPPRCRSTNCGLCPGVDVAELRSLHVEDPQEQREVDAVGRLRVDLTIEAVGELRQIGFERQPRPQRRLHVGHQQRGADALAGDVADQQRQAAVRQREVVEEVAADLARGKRESH